MVFKIIETKRNLCTPPKKTEAYLSDVFFILYLIYLSKKMSRINIQKIIVYTLVKLLEKDKLNEIKIFNLPFYCWKYGDYNKCISTNYIPELLKGGLIEEVDGDKNEYISTNKAERLFKKYEEENITNKKLLLVKEIIDSYPKDRISFLNTFRASHKRKVEDNGKELSVDDLRPDEKKAIAYNSNPDNVEGFKSNIVSTNYLLALGSLLEEEKPEERKESSEEQEKIVSGLLQAARRGV